LIKILAKLQVAAALIRFPVNSSLNVSIPTVHISQSHGLFRHKLAQAKTDLKHGKEPWRYDSTKPSLIGIPWVVLNTYAFAELSTRDIFNLYLTCKTFNRLIGKPTLEKHRNGTQFDEIM
jgi:hypothetical protein